MINESILGRTIQSSGIEDARIVRIDVLSVYLLQALSEAGMFSHMCFTGGNEEMRRYKRAGAEDTLLMDYPDKDDADITESFFRTGFLGSHSLLNSA